MTSQVVCQKTRNLHLYGCWWCEPWNQSRLPLPLDMNTMTEMLHVEASCCPPLMCRGTATIHPLLRQGSTRNTLPNLDRQLQVTLDSFPNRFCKLVSRLLDSVLHSWRCQILKLLKLCGYRWTRSLHLSGILVLSPNRAPIQMT